MAFNDDLPRFLTRAGAPNSTLAKPRSGEHAVRRLPVPAPVPITPATLRWVDALGVLVVVALLAFGFGYAAGLARVLGPTAATQTPAAASGYDAVDNVDAAR